jgi:hypothetical protein
MDLLSDYQFSFLIGAIFLLSSADIAFTYDLFKRRGLITPFFYPFY